MRLPVHVDPLAVVYCKVVALVAMLLSPRFCRSSRRVTAAGALHWPFTVFQGLRCNPSANIFDTKAECPDCYCYDIPDGASSARANLAREC